MNDGSEFLMALVCMILWRLGTRLNCWPGLIDSHFRDQITDTDITSLDDFGIDPTEPKLLSEG